MEIRNKKFVSIKVPLQGFVPSTCIINNYFIYYFWALRKPPTQRWELRRPTGQADRTSRDAQSPHERRRLSRRKIDVVSMPARPTALLVALSSFRCLFLFRVGHKWKNEGRKFIKRTLTSRLLYVRGGNIEMETNKYLHILLMVLLRLLIRLRWKMNVETKRGL